MPISVVCAGCKTRFEVSEKFAGKQGPCPKCKAIIKIPEAMADEVKIHAPQEFASGGKDQKGRPITKPVARVDARVNGNVVAAIIVGSVLALAVALVGRSLGGVAQVGLITVGLLIVGPPLAVCGYFFLRDDELEPYSGKELWVRACLCGLGYAVLWGVYGYLVSYGFEVKEPYQWLFVAPIFIGAGGGLALASFDLDFSSGAMHYCFYILVTLLLRFAIGLPPIWAATLAT